MNDTASKALIAALAAENAAVFGYGVVAARAAENRRSAVNTAITEHRAARDRVAAALTAGGTQAPPAALGYNPPFPVADAESAIRLALVLEEDCATGYRALLEQADADALRRLGLDRLTDVATRAATWRLALKISPSTVALPGAGSQR
ncbi:ferritin-like domain-containing protein [Williamsia sterculiae]|uniref:DUF4439 domain-containing protein n=1 Tax=Williamsia sterculiae TaxID=1344003 RepID=A0A1N7EBX3_9NOCA|nr:ferritin-like domain-containing protein [Williamsia sterculiae]SIR85564.1 protein of unknown function [Williamsia sterculiae]